MPRPTSPNPTPGELQILRVLWQRGPCTVREVHNALTNDSSEGYTNTLKMMQVMTAKGLLTKDDSRRPQVFEPAMSEEKTRTGLVDDLIQRAFGGAADQLILTAVSSRHVSREDLAHIKKLLKQLEEGDLS
jgi:BlaI family transcriptional regulator, penicillinase repressor